MPLIQSPKKKAIGKNIEIEVKHGKPQKQAIAIAYDVQRRNKAKKKKMADGGTVGGEIGYPGSTKSKGNPDHGSYKDMDERDEAEHMRMAAEGKKQQEANRSNYAEGGVAISAKTESRPSPENLTPEEVEMIANHRISKEQVSSWDEHKPTEDDQHSHLAEAGRHAAGGKISAKPVSSWTEGRATIDDSEDEYDKEELSLEHPSKESVQGWTDLEATAANEDHPLSIAESILKKRKMMAKGGMAHYADGGEVELEQNAEEEPNHEDDLSFEALRKENYSESEGLGHMGSPEDSNEHGDEEEKDEEDQHDMVSKIRSKMKMRKVGQRYSEE